MAQELVYSGHVISSRGEMLSLTDMWKAAGEQGAKQPAQWIRTDSAHDIFLRNSTRGAMKLYGARWKGVTFR